MFELLLEQGVRPALIEQVKEFVAAHPADEADLPRIQRPPFFYYGAPVWEQAITALLSGENLLLVGNKATGKNILADNLAWIFQRPSWNVSFHVNTDSASLIGTDTFLDGRVSLRKGPIARCAESGGFGILDEINMARNDALAVLHATLDYRRLIDVPGYERIPLRPETRFIATMNYGYIGTRELNEALTSRFVVIQVPAIGTTQLKKLLLEAFPSLAQTWLEQFALLFHDLQQKNENAEISTKPVDLRGLLSALKLISNGLNPFAALDMGLVNKSFDPFEQELVRDVIRLRLPAQLKAEDLFPGVSND
ncbi:MAG: AAA family ATPase [Ndongobacter sp.]|nr:AAA family ATPase [Ndongobacter sp.]